MVALLRVEPLADRAGGVLDAPELARVGFRPLATYAIGIVGVDALPTRVHVARYGDAYALPDTLDREVALRVISVLQSGRLVETRVIAPPTPEDDGRVELSADRAAGRRGWPDRLRAALTRRRLATRYPDRPAFGVHRQLLDGVDIDSLWVAHRGLLRRVQGTHDEVADHTRPELFPAALRRSWHVTAVVDQPDLVVARRASRGARNLLLALPAVVGLVQGLAWWASGLAAGVPAIFAVIARAAIGRPSLLPWLLASPVALALVGAATVGWTGILAVFAYDLVVALGTEFALTRVFLRWLGLGRGERPEPRPVPVAEMLARYG